VNVEVVFYPLFMDATWNTNFKSLKHFEAIEFPPVAGGAPREHARCLCVNPK
jgi:hypothetical protein